MFTISLPDTHNVGDTMDCRINGSPAKLTWRDKDTLVIGENDARKILMIQPGDNGLNMFVCTDKEPTCRSFQLPEVLVPDGCGEVIALIEKTFTTKLQWSYLRIYIELYEPKGA
jgi:hypothetical protein